MPGLECESVQLLLGRSDLSVLGEPLGAEGICVTVAAVRFGEKMAPSPRAPSPEALIHRSGRVGQPDPECVAPELNNRDRSLPANVAPMRRML